MCWDFYFSSNKVYKKKQKLTAHIEMVTLKIGLAETDEQLEDIIIKFLAPIIQKLNSNDPSLRSKVCLNLKFLQK